MKINQQILPKFRYFLFFTFQIVSIQFFLAQIIFSQEPQVDERPLTFGVKIERTVTGQAIHGYVVELKQGEVIRIKFIEKGVDVRAVVIRINDKQPISAVAKSGVGGFMQESLTMISDKDDVYELIVFAEQNTNLNKEAKYELLATKITSATSDNIQREKAEKLTQEVNEIFFSTDKEKLPVAINKLEESLKIWSALGDTYKQAIAKMKIGDANMGISNWIKAETYYLEALNLFNKEINKAEVGYVYGSLASVYLVTKNEEKTRIYTNKALEIFRNLGDTVLEKLLSNLSSSNLSGLEEIEKTGELPNIDEELSKAKTPSAKAATWAKVLLVYSFNEIGEEERPLFVRAEKDALNAAKIANDKDLETQILIGLGNSYASLAEDDKEQEQKDSDIKKAKLYLIRGLTQSKILNNQIFEFFAFLGLNQIYYLENDKLAVFFSKKLINSLQNYRQTLKATDKETQQLIQKMTKEVYEDIASDLTEQNRFTEALQVLNFQRDAEFLDFTLFNNQSPTKLDLTPREKDNEPIFNNLLQNLSSKYSKNVTSNYDEAINETENVFNTLENNFAVANSDKDIAANVKDLRDLQESLEILNKSTGKKHAVIYVYNDSSSYILINSQDIKNFDQQAFIDGVNNYDDFDKNILEFLQILESPSYDPRPLGAKLYDGIFRRAKQKISGNFVNLSLEEQLNKSGIEVIHWSLDGKLRYIPISVLYDEKTGQYLVEKYENVVFTRAKKERFLSEPKPWTKGIGFGTSIAYPNFSALPSVPKEVGAIFGDSTKNENGVFDGQVYMNKSFNSDSLLNISQKKPDFVHIASHFAFQPGDAKNSFLLLGDGTHFSLLDFQAKLFLFEGVDLLTLSACQTAAQQSDEATGKEVDGLAELVQRLGAKSVIATLWSIDDPSTSALMGEFYKIRKENPDVSKSEALRVAQLKLLNGSFSWKASSERRASRGVKTKLNNKTENRIPFTPDKETPYEHPYYWAPFVFYGSSNGKVTSDYILSKPNTTTNYNNPVSNSNNNFNRNSVAGTWSGKYVCGQGVTGATLKIEQKGNELQGLFQFYPLPENPTFKAGSGFYKGTFDPNFGVMQLNGDHWLIQPDAGWILVGFSGSFDENRQNFSGRMLSANCGGIELKRETTMSSDSLSGFTNTTLNPPNTNTLPQNNPYTIKEIESNFQAKLYDDVIKKARIFIQYESENKDALSYLGYSLLIRNNTDEAITYLAKAVKLGQPIPFFLKRGRANPILGLGQVLSDSQIIVLNDGIVIIDGDKQFQAPYNSLSVISLENYAGTCPVAFFQGLFVETRSKSEKVKADKKDFALFPQAANLVQVKQGNLTLFQISCYDQGLFPSAVIKLITAIRSR